MKKIICLLLGLSVVAAGSGLARIEDASKDEPQTSTAQAGGPSTASPPSPKAWTYHSSTSFSFLLARGNNESLSFGFDTDQTLGLGKDSLNLKGNVIYAKTNGLITNAIYYGHLKYNHQLGDGAYLLGLVRFDRDLLAGYPSRFSFSAGGGLTWLKTGSLSFLSDLAFGLSSENATLKVNLADPASSPADKSINSSFVSTILTNRFTFNITPSAQVIHQEIVFVDLHELDNYRLYSLSSLSASFSRYFGLRMSLQVNYEKKPVVGYKSTDVFLLSSLVVAI